MPTYDEPKNSGAASDVSGSDITIKHKTSAIIFFIAFYLRFGKIFIKFYNTTIVITIIPVSYTHLLDVDDKNYEDFTTFAFAAVETKGNPPVLITKDNYFCVNYKNFPDEIIVNGRKIN